MMRTSAAAGVFHCSNSDVQAGRGTIIAGGGGSIVEANRQIAHIERLTGALCPGDCGVSRGL
jgi:hypothetical protein